MSANVIIESINRTADDPSVAVYLPIPLARTIIELVGGEAVRTPLAPNADKWTFPDGFSTWTMDEALRYALEVAPDVLGEPWEAQMMSTYEGEA